MRRARGGRQPMGGRDDRQGPRVQWLDVIIISLIKILESHVICQATSRKHFTVRKWIWDFEKMNLEFWENEFGILRKWICDSAVCYTQKWTRIFYQVILRRPGFNWWDLSAFLSCKGQASIDESYRYSLLLVLSFCEGRSPRTIWVLAEPLGSWLKAVRPVIGRWASRSVIELRQSQDRFWWDSWLFYRDTFALVFFHLSFFTLGEWSRVVLVQFAYWVHGVHCFSVFIMF